MKPIALLWTFTLLFPLAAAAAEGPGAFPISDTPAVPEGLGVNIHFTDPRPGEMDMLAVGGFSWIRMDLSWGGTEREKGQYDFSAYDRLMSALRPHGIRALLILDYSNRHYDGGQSPRTDEGRKAFARWAAAAAVHFRGRGILWEMYNEPNIHFWRPEPNPEHYVLLALEVGRAIRNAAPGEIYIGPATSQVDLPFLETCFQAGLLEYWSAVSVHPYRQQPPETAAEDYAKLRRLIALYAPPDKRIPILSGEWGYSSVWQRMDAAKQGKLLPRQWLTNLAQHVPVSIWYDWHDDGRDPAEAEHHFGTVEYAYREGADPVYEPKPAYLAARTLTTSLRGFQFNKRLAVGGEDDYVLLFSQGDQVRLAAWTTSAEPRQVTVAASPGPFAVTGHTGEALAGVTAGEGGLHLRLTDAPQYLEPQTDNPLLQIAAAWTTAPLDLVAPAQNAWRLGLGLRNPLDRAIRAGAGTGAPIEIPAGGSATLDHRFDIGRNAEPQSVQLQCVVDGLGRIAQTLHVVAADPLRAIPHPVSGRRLPVSVENPAGKAFSASVRLADVEGLELSEREQRIEFTAGQTEQRVEFALNAPAAAAYRLGVIIDDGGVGLTVPAQMFRPVDDFGRYTADTIGAAYGIVPDGDAQVTSTESIELAQPPEGPPVPGATALKIAYRFDEGWKFARLVPRHDATRKIEGRPHAFGMWIYGDGSNNLCRLRVVDDSGQTFQPSGPSLSWRGWRYVVIPWDERQMGHWGGADDGRLHLPVRWDSLLLIDSAGRKATAGEIYIASPTLIE